MACQAVKSINPAHPAAMEQGDLALALPLADHTLDSSRKDAAMLLLFQFTECPKRCVALGA